MNSPRRVPISCPPGFLGRYVVVTGDTMYNLSLFFRVPLRSLVQANPHITVPSQIFPGDVLCVPGLVPFPCCVVLEREREIPTGTVASVLVSLGAQGTLNVSVVATLPPPQSFGNFDIYLFAVLIPEINGFGQQLLPVTEEPPVYAGGVSLPTAAQLTPTSTVVVRPSNSVTGIDGPVLLSATLANCCRPQLRRRRRVLKRRRMRRRQL